MKKRQRAVISILCVLLSVLSFSAWATSSLWFAGVTPTQTARILVEDAKFGERALWMAHRWGDRILEPLQSVSQDFQLLNGRNAIWVAEVISVNKSSRSRALARALYERDVSTAKLVGAVGLAGHRVLERAEFTTGVLHHVLTDNAIMYAPAPELSEAPWFGRTFVDTTMLELALIAAKQAESLDSVPDIIALIQKSHVPYSVHVEAIEALVAIGDRRAVPVLVDAMRSPDFVACEEALKALVAFRDDRAIPLAIERIAVSEEDPHWSPLAEELQTITGQKFGTNKQLWREWWASQGSRATHQG